MRMRTSKKLGLWLTLALVATALIGYGAHVAGAATPVTIYSTGFDTSPPPDDPASGWTIRSDSTVTAVTWGQTTRTPAHSGTYTLWCAAKNNAGSSYVNDMVAHASREIILSSYYTSAKIGFWYKVPSTDGLGGDFGTLSVSDESTVDILGVYGLYEAAPYWRYVEYSLDEYLPTAGTKPIRLQWIWGSDSLRTAQGMYIDDIAVTAVYDGPDITPPSTPVVTLDGTQTTALTQLHGNWTATDPDSGISEYQFSVGTSPGATNTADWASVDGTTTEGTATGLSLTPGQDYYMNVKAKNGAGLWSNVGSSGPMRAKSTSALTIATSNTSVTYRRLVTFSGILSSVSPTSGPLAASASYPIRIQRRLAGEATWTTVKSDLTSTASGAYSWATYPSTNASYRAVWGGTGVHTGSTSALRTVNVRPTVVLATSTHYVWHGRNMTLSGYVSPTRRYKTLYLQYKMRGSRYWRNIGTTSTNWFSRYTKRWAPGYRGFYYLRTYFPADAQNAANYSRTNWVVAQ